MKGGVVVVVCGMESIPHGEGLQLVVSPNGSREVRSSG
jgi:hypothetical protein